MAVTEHRLSTKPNSSARRFTLCIVELGAKMVPFAGYDMPVSYRAGVIKEHLHTRSAAGLVRRLAYGAGAADRRRPMTPPPPRSRRCVPGEIARA